MSVIHPKKPGFTIVELIIVIVVIAILAAIAIASYSFVRDDANNSKVDADLTNLEKIIHLARLKSGKTLGQITGNYCTKCSCAAVGGTTQYKTLPKTHDC